MSSCLWALQEFFWGRSCFSEHKIVTVPKRKVVFTQYDSRRIGFFAISDVLKRVPKLPFLPEILLEWEIAIGQRAQ
ncbi:hypothetical protein CEXT_322231 [Caerostris extrusa]|uniref:Uncharacterized protein n=1 Tax=Caerostris extrusa TaxID=172846 RepID=A0AAV4MZZ9_CAEEX|nr:hypothetical protein CEXT_322231 [Caerostris extrusa]